MRGGVWLFVDQSMLRQCMDVFVFRCLFLGYATLLAVKFISQPLTGSQIETRMKQTE
jgi:hypothetical protein